MDQLQVTAHKTKTYPPHTHAHTQTARIAHTAGLTLSVPVYTGTFLLDVSLMPTRRVQSFP